MSHYLLKNVVLTFGLSCFFGCAMGPTAKIPVVEMPSEFAGEKTVSDQPVLSDLAWWSLFEDPVLQDLILVALADNYDLRIAMRRVEQHEATVAQTRSAFLPQVGYMGNLERSRNAFNGNPVLGASKTGNPVMVAASAAWELDLWGRIRRMNESARARLAAGQAAQRGVMLSLVCGVAQAYFELLELDEELEIARRTVASFQESLDIFSRRLAGGAASRLEVARAEAALAATAAAIPELERQMAIKENEIRLLLGHNPGKIAREPGKYLAENPPQIPAGVPSDLLLRRPDILAAEQNLRAANAQIGAAIAQCFPKIGLTAVLGRISADLDSLNSDAAAWGIGGNLLGPIFQGGALLAQIRLARAQTEEQALCYEQTVRAAFQETADVLITRARLEEIFQQQKRCVICYNDAVQVARERYLAGKAGYYEVLEAQQQLFPAENELARTRFYRHLVLVQLYKVLGGGWHLTEEQWRREKTD